MQRTKIVCTIGPASDSKSKLKQMVRVGMDCARLNFSHGDYKSHLATLKKVRQVAKETGSPLPIIQDLQGPKIRVGKLPEEGVVLKPNQEVVLKTGKVMQGSDIPVNFSKFAALVKTGDLILLDDGQFKLEVKKVAGNKVFCKVVYGGKLTSNKGVNLPTIKVKIPSITKKDKEDLEFGIKNNVDFVALSFVQEASDIIQLRKLIGSLEKKYKFREKKLPGTKIIAKIEKPQAVENIDAIIRITDGIMIARGDLGIEAELNKIPVIQKDIIGKCMKLAKPVIVATQMLESMIEKPLPTRAEVSDVANAVVDHADAVMLSGETASGKNPVQAVETMNNVIEKTEESPYDDLDISSGGVLDHSFAISYAAADLAKKIKVAGIIVTTLSGVTAQVVSKYRPELPIVALVAHEKIKRQLALSWGVNSYMISTYKDVDALMNSSLNFVRRKKMFMKGDKVIMVTGQPTGKSGTTNLLKIVEI